MDSHFKGVNIGKLEKDVLKLIEKHGSKVPLGTNLLQQLGLGETIKEGFFLLMLIKDEQEDKIGIKRITFGSGMTIYDLQQAFEATLLGVLGDSGDMPIGQA